ATAAACGSASSSARCSCATSLPDPRWKAASGSPSERRPRTTPFWMPSMRRSERQRETKETRVRVAVDLDGPGRAEVGTGLPFFDHMLEQLGRHGGLDLVTSGGISLHVRLLSGRNPHHILECAFKGVARALSDALMADPRRGAGPPSTKGAL